MNRYLVVILIVLIMSMFLGIGHASDCCPKPKKCADGTQGKVYVILVSGESRLLRVEDGAYSPESEAMSFEAPLQYIRNALIYLNVPNLVIYEAFYDRKNPTKNENIVYDSMKDISNKVRNCDMVMFFYSGHGWRKGIVVSNIQFNTELIGKFAADIGSKGAKIFFLFDSCESGGFANNIMKEYKPRNTMILSSTRLNEGCSESRPPYFYGKEVFDYAAAYSLQSNVITTDFRDNLIKANGNVVLASTTISGKSSVRSTAGRFQLPVRCP
ncbi:MAG: caspase family protein [Candidatus Aenigmatarchaeota archaeon]